MNHKVSSGKCSGSTCSLQWAGLLEPRKEMGYIGKPAVNHDFEIKKQKQTAKIICHFPSSMLTEINNCKVLQNQVKLGQDEHSNF